MTCRAHPSEDGKESLTEARVEISADILALQNKRPCVITGYCAPKGCNQRQASQIIEHMEILVSSHLT